MLEITKQQSVEEVESNNQKKVIRLNCDWEIEKVVVHFINPQSKKNSYLTFTGNWPICQDSNFQTHFIDVFKETKSQNL